MPPKPRAVRMESKSALAAMQKLETKSDEELEAETRYKSAAQAILGARAAERYDARKAREHFRVAIAAARPQERLQLRRMAEASLALAERRPDDLKAAAEKLGQPVPTGRQLFALRLMGLIAPAPGASFARRAAGILLLVAIVLGLLLAGFLIVRLLTVIPGVDIGIGVSFFWGFLVVCIALSVLACIGRRRQKRAQAARTQART